MWIFRRKSNPQRVRKCRKCTKQTEPGGNTEKPQSLQQVLGFLTRVSLPAKVPIRNASKKSVPRVSSRCAFSFALVCFRLHPSLFPALPCTGLFLCRYFILSSGVPLPNFSRTERLPAFAELSAAAPARICRFESRRANVISPSPPKRSICRALFLCKRFGRRFIFCDRRKNLRRLPRPFCLHPDTVLGVPQFF